MKMIILGDIHGRDIWKQIILNEKTFDKLVFIGDYVDSFNIPGEKQLENLLDIIQYKKDNPDKVVLLFGNHDYHYLMHDSNLSGERYSGFQHVMAPQFKMIFNDNIKLFQMAYEPYGKIYCSHAGISSKWLKLFNIENDKNVVQTINDYFYYKPSVFRFNGFDLYGDTPSCSPIWIRPNSMNNHGISGTHIVGHTEQPEGIRTFEGPRCTMYLIDKLPIEYLVIENSKIRIAEVENYI